MQAFFFIFFHQLDISLPEQDVSPGFKVEIGVQTSPKAFVGLLAVDKSVILYQKGNDIDKKKVLNIMRYDPSKNYEPLKVEGSRYENFGGSNSFVLTNALNKAKPKLSPRFGSSEDYSDEAVDEELQDYDDIFENTVGLRGDNMGVKIRKDFRETWIFDTFSVGTSGQKTLYQHVPDTITSWVFTGFSLDKENGLGISEPKSLFVKKKMFIKLNLPYSIRWGEILKVEVLVHNYIPESERKINLSVDVKMLRNEDDPDFEFIDSKKKCVYESSEDSSRMKLVSVARNSMSTTFFLIKPLKVGKIKLSLQATGQQVEISDHIEKEILVESEGITIYNNHPVMIDLVKGEFDANSYELKLSNEIVPKSIQMGVSLDSDLMGKPLVDVSNLM